MANDKPRRLWATTCIAAATVTALTIPAVPAHAEPSPQQVAAAKKKLTKLSEQVDQLVEKYNQVGEDLKAARKKLNATRQSAQRELRSFEGMRGKVAEMAASAYKNGEQSDVVQFTGAKDPQSILDQAAVLTHLSQNRASQLTQFLSAAQRVQRQQAQAQEAFDKVNGKAKELKSQKGKVDKAIAQQRKLIRLAGGDTAPRGGGGSTYNGPATGAARVALQFAAAQVGDPYVYGGTGPSGWDCSGLTQAAWRKAGVSLGRTTYAQHADTVGRGRSVSFGSLQPGDLVFFNGLGHMGIFAGGGMMYHAPRTGRNVEKVSITSGYYRSNFHSAGRP